MGYLIPRLFGRPCSLRIYKKGRMVFKALRICDSITGTMGRLHVYSCRIALYFPSRAKKTHQTVICDHSELLFCSTMLVEFIQA